MDNAAYVRCDDTARQFRMTFRYVNLDIRIDRTFNFNRKLSESVGNFLDRICTNVSKVYLKKEKQRLIAADAVLLFEDSIPVDREVICQEVFQNVSEKSRSVTLKVFDTSYKLVVNMPWIESMSLPNACMATFPIYPVKVESCFMDRDLSTYRWYKSLNKDGNWELVGHKFIYVPTNEDVGYYLKLACTPRNSYVFDVSPTVEEISNFKVEASPGPCLFQDRHKFTTYRLKDKSLRLVSYNILADCYCDSDFSRTSLFPYCPPYALSIDYRKQLILQELIGYNADIICLQEVDTKTYKYDLKSVFEHLGYNVVYHPKGGGTVTEGLSCIYRKDRFRELQVNFEYLGKDIDKNPLYKDIWTKVFHNEKLVECLQTRSTILQTITLECSDRVLLIANTHLYYHPNADHIRLLQGCMAIRSIITAIKELKEKTSKNVALVFCGDFNSVPECGIYQLYTTGSLSKQFADWSSNPEEEIKDMDVSQSLPLQSACGCPEFTNNAAGYKACLDYIYYDTSQFEVTQVVPLPTQEDLLPYVALPSVVSPSDHVALVADLKML